MGVTTNKKKNEIFYTENEIVDLFHKIEKFFNDRKYIDYAFLARIYASISSIFAKQDQNSIKTLSNNYQKIITSSQKESEEYIDILKLNLEELAQKYTFHKDEEIHKLFTHKIITSLRNLYPQLYQKYESISNPQGIFLKKIENIIEEIHRHENEIKNLKENELEINKKEIKKLLVYLKNKKIEADNIVGDLAENKNAQRYILYAEKNRKSAFWLFWFSVTIMGSLALFSAFALYFTEITSKDLFVRISLFFAILLPAFFMMRESKKLKDKEFQYTDMAYRIVTSGPYIDGLNLPPNEKAKLKAELVKDFFGRPIECRDDGGLPPIESICEIIKTCLNNYKRD